MNRIVKPLLIVIIGITAVFLICCGRPTAYTQHDQTVQTAQTKPQVGSYINTTGLTFRNLRLLNDHFEKHGKEMGFSSAKEYEKAAAAVVSNPKALHKTEAEDGDDVYYLKSTNEFVIVSTDGYIRTYFKPDSGIKYYNKQ